MLYALSAGTVTITATQAGDDSYLAAEPVAREVEIIDIVRITPLVTAPTATAITYGETVAASQIVGGKLRWMMSRRLRSPVRSNGRTAHVS